MEISKERRERWEALTKDGPFNKWLRPLVSGPDGNLDLDKLHALALDYGIDRRAQYAHLNPGQQRMNLGNILRRVVPVEVYEGGAAPPAAAPQVEDTLPLRRASVRELLRLHSEVMDELRRREIVRTSNSPVGDYAELLFAMAFGWELAGSSTAGHDATDRDGQRYQIKSRRQTPLNSSRLLSAFRNLPDCKFDFLAAVLFDQHYRVARALILPHEALEARCRFSAHTNGWRLRLDDECWMLKGAQDVTEQVRAAADQI
jgi:hypothetical protein